MQLRFPRIRRVSSALLVGVTSWVGLTSPAQAAALRPRLIHQDATVVVGPNGNGHFGVALHAGSASDTTLRISIFPALRTRNGVESVIAGQKPAGDPLDSTGAFVMNCRHGERVVFDVAIGEWRNSYVPCGGVHPTLSVRCATRCNGVYPLSYSLTAAGNQITMWSLVTITNGRVTRPVHLVWILKSQATTVANWNANAKALADLVNTNETLALGLSANELNASLYADNPAAKNYVATLRRFLENPFHTVVPMGAKNMDYGSLRSHGLGVDVPQHFAVIDQLANEITPQVQLSHAVFLPGLVGATSATAVDHQGRHSMVIGEEALRTQVSRSLSWGSPFHITGVPSSARAVVVDSPLASLANRSDIEPGRLAALTMGALSMLYYQAPNAANVRTEVITTSLSQASPVFTSELNSDLAHSPLLGLRELDSALAPSLIGANHHPTVRTLATAPAAPWHSSEIAALANLNAASGSLVSTFSDPAPFIRIELARLNAELGLGSHAAGVRRAQDALSAELAKFRVDQNTVIMASNSGTIPVTLYSSANYGITGLLHVSADRISFPDGAVVPVGLLTQTGSTPIRASMTTGTSSLMRVRLTTIDGKVTIASGTVQVRYATASVVGYALSAGSLLVIAWWWWRTTRRKSPAKHAR